MRTRFAQSIGRLARILHRRGTRRRPALINTPLLSCSGSRALCSAALLCLALEPFTAFGTDDFYINYGTITTPPQIDAFNFVNYGTFSIFTLDPFETSNTRNFTNYGSLTGASGWWFDNSPAASGARRMADSFVNHNGAVVQGLDEPLIIFIGVPNVAPVSPSYLWVQATNIVSQGLLHVGANGWLLLQGDTINLARSGLEVDPIAPSGSFNGFPFYTNFLPETGISDLWWGQTNLTFDSRVIWFGSFALSPPHDVQFVDDGFGLVEVVAAPPFVADSLVITNGGVFLTLTNLIGTNIVVTNVFAPTNLYRQAVFVGLADPSIQTVDVHYFPSTSLTNPFTTVAVQLGLQTSNVVTLASDFQTLYFYDTLASETNRGILDNVINGFGSRRPANYVLARADDGTFLFGSPGNNGVPELGFLFDPLTFSNNIVAGEYAGYRAHVDNIVSRPPIVPGGTITNLPGRIQILADSLDLRGTRLRGEGEVLVNTKHLVGSSNAVVDCESLSYDLGSTNGNLNVVNLTGANVKRLRGDLFAFSAVWSNQMTLLYTNYSIDTNGVATPAPITNGLTVHLHVLILDGSTLVGQLPVTVYDFITHSTNVVVNDNMSIVETLFIDGRSFTLNGAITLSSVDLVNTIGQFITISLSDWRVTNAPSLLYFTNHGILTIPNEAHFGDDRAIPYSGFVNTGSVGAASMALSSLYFENAGSLSAAGRLTIKGGTGVFQNGRSTSTDVDIRAANLKLNNYNLIAGGGLFLSVTNALLDAGGGSGNLVQVNNGFSLARKPQSGDLLGTTFQTIAPDFAEVDHVWPGEDRGASPGGYTNNVALGQLVVGPAGRNNPLFFFAGSGAANGLYVDLLDLSQLGTNYQSLLDIDSSLVIYYAAAALAFTPPPTNGVPQQPEEYLDGQFDGHLRWVRDFAGPNSSVAVVSNGVSILVNRALRNSLIIDSNGNGIPNGRDPFPFDNPLVAKLALVKPPLTAVLSWNAIAHKVYSVQATTNLIPQNWQTLMYYTNSASTNAPVTVQIPVPPGSPRQFYRVGITAD